jgi:hypothetical protein
VIAGEFLYLVKLPRLVIEAGDATKQKRRAVAVNFIVYFIIFSFQIWHEWLLRGSSFPSNQTEYIRNPSRGANEFSAMIVDTNGARRR